MKSIKPGRGPLLEGMIGNIFAAVFGVIWTLAAASMGAPPFFLLFGVVFVILGIVRAIYSYNQATSENRHSAYDIVDEHEEPDPLNEYFGKSTDRKEPDTPADGFCPYCGAPAESEYAFCRRCGKVLPK